MSRAAFNIRKRVVALRDWAERTKDVGTQAAFLTVLDIIDEEIEAEAERQFTRPISQQAELSKNLKENK